MSILLEEDEFSFPQLIMEIPSYLQKIKLIEPNLSFPPSIPPSNVEQKEEEIHLFDVSSSFNTFEETNNLDEVDVSSPIYKQVQETNNNDLKDDYPKNTDFTSNNGQNSSMNPLYESWVLLLNDDKNSGIMTGKVDKKKNIIFKVVSPKREWLFNVKQINSAENTNKFFLRRKKLPDGRPFRDRLDNIRVKSKRCFFNKALNENLNELLKHIGSKKYFLKFPQHLVSDVDRKRNKELFELTLKEFIEDEELNFDKKNNDFGNYYHNLDVIQDNEVKNSLEFEKILNKTIYQLYKEYINSDAFKINEMNRLKYIKKEEKEPEVTSNEGISNTPKEEKETVETLKSYVVLPGDYSVNIFTSEDNQKLPNGLNNFSNNYILAISSLKCKSFDKKGTIDGEEMDSKVKAIFGNYNYTKGNFTIGSKTYTYNQETDKYYVLSNSGATNNFIKYNYVETREEEEIVYIDEYVVYTNATSSVTLGNVKLPSKIDGTNIQANYKSLKYYEYTFSKVNDDYVLTSITIK